ncbi:hypothetical protein POM88_041777 [Heracleum sosnowskyi]|uniref:Myb-like domain-containing protein n=1 Tax=Heracleum sosnowskyi TaxID=360622 RepID=A0AAD8HFM3_9APIA|nr:hypothetical protein POM88_041777 [Heracleum sosnowskyi]
MAPIRRREPTSRPWIAAIEALASSETDTSLLTDLVKKIPGEFREDEGKNARELVCWRILESLSLLQKGNSSTTLSKPDSSARFSLSDCCEDVLRKVQCRLPRANQKSTESVMSGRDVEAFVRDKRSCLPKSGLEKLKDVISKESDLIPFSVKEMSGLLKNNRSDGNATRPQRSASDTFENPLVGDLSSENATRPQRSASDAFENPPVGDLSSGKTVMSDSATANQGGSSAPNQLLVYKEYSNIASLNRKQDAFCAQKVVECKDSDSFNERRNVDHVPGTVVQHSGREESDLPREPRVENLREITTSDNVDYDRVASKKLKMSSTVGDAELLHNQLQDACNIEKITQGTSGKEHGLNIRADESIKDCEGFVELETRGGSARFVNQGTKSVDGSRENSEHGFSLTPNSVRCGEVKDTMEHDHQAEFLSDDENDEILIRNNTFLNSQYSHSQDSLATLNGTKKLCMVCKIGGQLLVCSSVSCQRMVHEKCMGVAPTFDAARSFYCPFCAYSQAISEYSESKKKLPLARKALVTFINRDEYRVRNSSNISHRADQNYLKESKLCNECVEQNRPENVGRREIENSSRKYMRDMPSVSHDSSSRERARDVTCGANEEDQYVASQAVQDSVLQNSKSKDKKIAHKQHVGTEKEQDVSNQPPVLPCEPAKTTHSNLAKSSGKKKKSVTHLSLRVRKGEQQYTYPSLPQLKRKKIPWSNAEEEALKEGVRKFASNHDRLMPWKTILEFGGDIFVNRTTIDLKDKWRNICKASPKV